MSSGANGGCAAGAITTAGVAHGAATQGAGTTHRTGAGAAMCFWTPRNSFVFRSAAIEGVQQGFPFRISPRTPDSFSWQSGHIMEPTGFGIGHESTRTGSPTLKTRKRDARRTRHMCDRVMRITVENIYNRDTICKHRFYAAKTRGTLPETRHVTSYGMVPSDSAISHAEIERSPSRPINVTSSPVWHCASGATSIMR